VLLVICSNEELLVFQSIGHWLVCVCQHIGREGGWVVEKLGCALLSEIYELMNMSMLFFFFFKGVFVCIVCSFFHCFLYCSCYQFMILLAAAKVVCVCVFGGGVVWV
jgi:hypothetical protein